MSCCSEPSCRRKQPILVRRGPLSGQWMALTRYKYHGDSDRRPGLIEAIEKHELLPEIQVEIELGSTVMRAVFDATKAAYEEAERGSDAEAAYRFVLDRFEELTASKETQLVGPAPDDPEGADAVERAPDSATAREAGPGAGSGS